MKKIRTNIAEFYVETEGDTFGGEYFWELIGSNKYEPDTFNFLSLNINNNVDFLESYNGKVKLGHFNPKGVGLPYDPMSYNLLATWDLLMIDYRVINMDDCYLNYTYPINDRQTRNMFWREIFNKTFYLMSPLEKYGWMNTW
jgi:hypothetical protein